MIGNVLRDDESPFLLYEPVEWCPFKKSDRNIYSLRCDHGDKTKYVLHNPNDKINSNKSYLENILIEYKINELSYALYTIEDLLRWDSERGAEKKDLRKQKTSIPIINAQIVRLG